MAKRTEAYYYLIDDNLPSIWQIRCYLQDVIKECNSLICPFCITKWAVNATISTNIFFFLFCQFINGTFTRLELGHGKHLKYGLCSRQFLDLFKDKKEVQLLEGGKKAN